MKRRPRDDGSKKTTKMCYLYLISIPCFLQKSRGAWQQHMQTQSRAKGMKDIVYQSIAIHLCGIIARR